MRTLEAQARRLKAGVAGVPRLWLVTDARRLPNPLPAAARYRAFMADTLQRLRDGRAPLVGFADYVRVMQLADHIYARAEVRA